MARSPRFTSIFAVAALLLTALTPLHQAHAEKLRALFGDGSVRYASAGPVGLNADQKILIGLLLPAVRGAKATAHFADNTGKVLLSKSVEIPTAQIPTDGSTAFWSINFTIETSQNGAVSITDGTTTDPLTTLTSSNQVSILIGLLLPAVQKVREAAARQHVGSIQIANARTGDINGILPFIEQSVVAKSLNFTR